MTYGCDGCGTVMDLKTDTIMVGQLSTGSVDVGELWRLLVLCPSCGVCWTLECDAGTGYRVRMSLRFNVVREASGQRKFDREFIQIVEGVFDE